MAAEWKGMEWNGMDSNANAARYSPDFLLLCCHLLVVIVSFGWVGLLRPPVSPAPPSLSSLTFFALFLSSLLLFWLKPNLICYSHGLSLFFYIYFWIVDVGVYCRFRCCLMF